MVIEGAAVRSYPLAWGRPVDIGRTKLSDICIDDDRTSREHAKIGVDDDGLWVEDLGSANGTRVAGQRVPSHTKTRIAPGQTVEIGTALLVVPSRALPPVRVRPSSYGHLLDRLEDVCAEISQAGRSLALIRLRICGEAPAEAVQQAVTEGLRNTDIVATYAPGELHLLLPETSIQRAEQTADNLERRLDELGLHVSIGLACAPEHGREPNQLLRHAGAELDPGATVEVPTDLVLESERAREAVALLKRVAPSELRVLLLGETGVGKERFARLTHELSPRAAGPFLALNCAAVTPTLAESELFGHVRGAFSGATADKKGLFEAAQGGTLFLDEIGEMPLELQAKLLRVLQERRVRRVGGTDERPIDVRVVAATNRDLEAQVEEGHFRADLMYRLNAAPVHIPPLRERKADIPALARHFVRRFTPAGKPRPALTPEALDLLIQYPWKGNIRELENEMERAVAMQTDGRIEPSHLNERLRTSWAPAPRPVARATAASALTADEEAERARIAEALEICGGNQTQAAVRLGYSRRTLTNRLNQFGFPRPRKTSQER
jgi:two-component system response regulator AtoC